MKNEFARCRASYEENLDKRRSYPLNSGVYKLREVLVLLRQQAMTVDEIVAIVCGKSMYGQSDLIGDCLASERGHWLKALPKSIAGIFGYCVIPAVEALQGDYVPNGPMQDIIGVARQETNEIVQRCDQIEACNRTSIHTEYAAMKHGRSQLVSLLSDAIGLVEQLLSRAEVARLRVVSTGV